MHPRHWTDAAGTINRRYVTVSRKTGCWRWKRPVRGRCSGPTASLPKVVLAELGIADAQRAVSVRKWVWQRAGRDVPVGMMVAAGCGDPRCVLLDHAELRFYARKVTEDILDELIARRPTEGTTAAARRLGVTTPTILRNLGHLAQALRPFPAGRTLPHRGTPRRQRIEWLRQHAPEQRPPEIRVVDWQCLQRLMQGETMQSIADDLGVSKARVSQRIVRAAGQLGWHPGLLATDQPRAINAPDDEPHDMDDRAAA